MTNSTSKTPQPPAQDVSDMIGRLRTYAIIQRRRRWPENAKLVDEAADLIAKLAARELQQAQVVGESGKCSDYPNCPNLKCRCDETTPPQSSAPVVGDTELLDGLERLLDEQADGMLLLHHGQGAGRGITGLGLRNTGRTLRQAIIESALTGRWS